MSFIVKEITNGYDYLYSLTDPRSRHYFLYGSPIYILLVLTFYWMFVKKWGPKIMENRDPIKLDRIIQIYNLFQVAANAYVLLKIFAFHFTYGINFRCQVIDFSTSQHGIDELNLVYIYVLLKVFDLCDTIFFVLRKKYNQVTFLHVYHHIMMVLFCYTVARIVPGGQALFLGILNTFIHIVMYSYYFLTSYSSEFKKKIWWKRHLTELQICQFGLLCIHGMRPLIYNDCDYPNLAQIIIVLQATIMLFLFSNFYRRVYLHKKKNQS